VRPKVKAENSHSGYPWRKRIFRLMTPKKDLNERLKQYPELAKQFEALLDIVEGEGPDRFNPNVAEEKTVVEVKKLGNQMLEDWAKTQEQWLIEDLQQQVQPIKRNGKKNSTG